MGFVVGCGRHSARESLAVQPKPEVSIGAGFSIREFSFGGIGDAGVTSEGEKLFFRVLSSSGRTGLVTLYQYGDAQAQAYALVGLRWVAPDDYAKLRDHFLSQPVTVTNIRGCTVTFEAPFQIIAAIEAGAFDSFRSRAVQKG
jgi:hypothetical protein